MDKLNDILRVDQSIISQRKVFDKRKARIMEAKSWSVGTAENKIYHTIWEEGDYKVSLGKPGKEAGSSYRGKLNPYDMAPTIFFKNTVIERNATFQDVVKDLEEIGKKYPDELELIGCLLFRSAFLLDHKKMGVDGENEIYRYHPNDEVVRKINESVSLIYGVPPIVFLHYLDAIALNEDVKYDYHGYDLSSKSVGGKNNMLTYVNLIAVIAGKKPLYTLTGPLLRSGVAAITLQDAFKSLPHIK